MYWFEWRTCTQEINSSDVFVCLALGGGCSVLEGRAAVVAVVVMLLARITLSRADRRMFSI